MTPNDPDQQGWIAGILAFAGLLFGAAWKSWFGVRKDARDDRRGQIINGTYEGVVTILREQLAQEIERRHRAETRVAELEAKLRALSGDSPL
jgi:hypothetical protein